MISNFTMGLNFRQHINKYVYLYIKLADLISQVEITSKLDEGKR